MIDESIEKNFTKFQEQCCYIKCRYTKFALAIHTHVRLEDEIKQPAFQSEAQKALVNLMYTSGWLEQRQQSAFKLYGLTGPQFNILRILRGQHPLPATVAMLIDRMLDKTSNASRIVDKLEEKKLATRTVCPANRRAVDIRITEAGLRLLRQIDDDGKVDPASCGFDNLTPSEQRQLNVLLDKLRS
jgi:DNA-binding MarR family transcriptional regulator